jgi:hypothetical protein
MKFTLSVLILLTSVLPVWAAESYSIPGQGSYAFDSATLDGNGRYPVEGILSQDSSFILGHQGSYTFAKGQKLTFTYEKVAGKLQGFVTYGVPKKDASYNIPGQGSFSFAAGEPVTCDYMIEKTGVKCYITSGALARQYTFTLADGSKYTAKAGTVVQFTYEKVKGGVKGFPVSQ